ncbi:hypothetical protein TBK1r_33750 [Stieleria magnilauensis]|uniref:Uncharacterized protein n=1 Tax=Stieleria magnilauensis TaxID=2527963 RepID=A0ABX5XU06_9BACT|nr:hypothetical protein TBK1r_33750 [Planctomycetes bacterium TBK1r]
MGPGAGGFSGEWIATRFGSTRSLASLPGPAERLPVSRRLHRHTRFDPSNPCRTICPQLPKNRSMNSKVPVQDHASESLRSPGFGLAHGQVSQRWAEDTGAPSQRSRRIMRGSEIVFLNVFASNLRTVRQQPPTASPARVKPVAIVRASVWNVTIRLKSTCQMMFGTFDF